MASGLQTESWTEEITCPICLDFFTDPVSLECGHNFCRSCITRSWEKQETYRCAVCQETFPEKSLRVNRALASLAEKARKFSLTPRQMELKLHCEKHREELKLFCESDQKLLCVVCSHGQEHRDHRFLPIDEAVEIYKEQVKSSSASLTQRKETALQAQAKQKQNISQLKEQASSLQTQVKDDFAKIHQILTDREQRVMIDLRQREEEILQRMETNLREIQSNLDSVQQQISELQTQMEKDGPIFLQEEAARKKRQEENILGDGGPKRQSEALTNPKFKIEVLELQDHNLGDCGVKQLCEDLMNLESKIPNLWLSDIDLTTDSTEDLSSDLKINYKLTELNLSHNKLGDRGVKRLCEALRNPECKIQSLELNSNNLTADCTEDLTSALSTNHSLTELYLSSNKLGDCGVNRLCEALRNPECKIQTLWLDSNRLTDGCTDALVSALSTNRSLRILNLSSNSFTDGSVSALRRLIQTCTSLERIWLLWNGFSSDGKNQLKSLRGIRPGLSVTV